MPKRTTPQNDEFANDLQDDFRFAHNDGRHEEHARRLNAHDERFRKLESRLDATSEELGDHLVGHGAKFPSKTAKTDEQEALAPIAKAQQAIRTYATPEGLLRKADQVISSPTEMGVVAGFISAGDLTSAAGLVAKAQQRAEKLADESQHPTDNPLDRQLVEHDLRQKISKMERILETLTERMAQVEARHTPAAQLPPEEASRASLAKAASVLNAVVASTPNKNDASGLLARADAAFTMPSQVGLVSSLVQAGRLTEAQGYIERAEARVEGERAKRERRVS